MKTGKKIFMAAVVLLGVGFLANCHRHRHDPEGFLKRVDNYVEDLELNADQQTKYQGIRARVKADMEARQTERKEMVGRLNTEFEKNDPNVKGSAADVKKQIAAMSGAMDRAPDYFLEFYAILNPEQQKKVNETLRTKLNRWQRWHS